MNTPTWGIVSTIKAPAKDILTFAAYHLDLGAHSIHIYLDEDVPAARAELSKHPKCHVVLCNDVYWHRRFKQKGRPEKHQQRQSANATHCYRHSKNVDWLIHLDVDEFLLPFTSLEDQLKVIPEGCLSARVQPAEALAPNPDHPPPKGVTFLKSAARERQKRQQQTQAIFPRFGSQLNGGFLSHIEGKVFVRTGVDKVSLRIHSAFVAGVRDNTAHEMPETLLAHFHAPSWEQFIGAFRFRLSRGSYRKDLKPKSAEGLNMHTLLSSIERDGGEAALRSFFQEVCLASPALKKQLAEFGLLHRFTLDADAKLSRHFPDFVAE